MRSGLDGVLVGRYRLVGDEDCGVSVVCRVCNHDGDYLETVDSTAGNALRIYQVMEEHEREVHRN